MAIVLPPLAIMALRVGVTALALAALRARLGRAPLREDREAALDALPEGGALTIDPDAGRADAALRVRRILRWGERGRGLAVEAAALARLRVRSLPPAR